MESERMERLLDEMPGMVLAADPDAACFFCNRQWHAYTGLSPEQSAGRGFLQGMHPADVERASPSRSSAVIAEVPRTTTEPEAVLAAACREVAESLGCTRAHYARIDAARDAATVVRLYSRSGQPEGRIGVVVGDVSGKGLDAAVQTALVKFTLRAFAGEDLEATRERLLGDAARFAENGFGDDLALLLVEALPFATPALR